MGSWTQVLCGKLRKKCLTEELSIENVCIVLLLAIDYNENELVKTCEKLILLRTADVLATKEFSQCSRDVLVYIMKMKIISCTEVDMFIACMKWVLVQSKQKVLSKALVDKCLGNLFYQILFASMTVSEMYVLKMIYPEVLSGMDVNSLIFNKTPRQIKWNGNKNAIVECDRDDDGNDDSEEIRYSLDNVEKTIFSTNEPLILDEFECNEITYGRYDPQDLESDSPIKVEITEARTLDNTNSNILSNITGKLGTNSTIISFSQPILLRPDFVYTISIKGFPEDHYYKSFDLKRYITLDSGTKITFHNDRIVNGRSVGLIWKLKFNKI